MLEFLENVRIARIKKNLEFLENVRIARIKENSRISRKG